MKTFAVALLLSASASAAFAQDIQALSHIDRATVYPQGADIERVAKVDLQIGDNPIVFADLPANVDPQSIRVLGSGPESFEIGSIDTKVLSDANLSAGKRKDLEAQIEKLTDERVGLDGAIADYETERKLLLTIADKTRVQTASSAVANTVDVGGFDVVVTTVATRLAVSSKAILEARIRQRQIAKDIAELQLKIRSFAPDSTQHLQALVHVKTKSAETAEFKLTYRVPNAAWHAFYDARLSLPKAGEDPHLTLVRRANVEQATGEDWNDVQLILSTAQPAGNAAVPELDEQPINILAPTAAKPASIATGGLQLRRDEERLRKNLKQRQEGDEVALDAAAAPQEAEEQNARMEQAGFNANYVIDGQVSIDKNGTSKKVNIGADDYKTKLVVESVPRLDTNAYLTASFLTSTDAPLLAGPVNLFRDGSYVGQVEMAEFASGEEAKLGFGIDDLVKVKRNEVKRLAAQEGLLTTSNTQEMAWNITVHNFHTTKMPIRIIDRKPFSGDVKITVADLTGATPATITDLEQKRGVLAWDLNLEPKAKGEIKTGYKITVPKDLRVGEVD